MEFFKNSTTKSTEFQKGKNMDTMGIVAISGHSKIKELTITRNIEQKEENEEECKSIR